MKVRSYQPGDRAAVRSVCWETGYMGEPADWFWRDRESFADLFSGYYTDQLPHQASVVEVDGVVSGYLLGCASGSTARASAGAFTRNIVRRGIAFRRGTAGVIWRTISDSVFDTITGRTKPRDLEFDDPRYPAHLHIDLLPAARGQGAGRRMINDWLDRLRTESVPGCHLQTLAENTNAIAFFQAVGFRRHGDIHLVPGFRTRTGRRHHLLTMVIDLT